MAAAGHPRPEGGICQSLHATGKRTVRGDVLIEPQLASRPDNPAQLRQGSLLIGNCAENQRDDAGVELGIAGRQVIGDPAHNSDGNRRPRRGKRRRVTQSHFRLNSQYPLNCSGI